MASTITLSAEHLAAWDQLARAHAAVSGRAQEALTEAGLPPLAWYQLLNALSAAGEEGMRMSDLAEAMILSRGGLTKLLDRLVSAGLVERRACPTDRRVSNAILLPAGEKLFAEMRPVVEAELETSFVGSITGEEAELIAQALGRIQGAACSL